MELDRELINDHIAAHPHRLLFVTLSGAHLYGFPSPDSDYDLRGAQVLAAEAMLELDPPQETHDHIDKDARVEIDLVAHDVRKFFLMLLKKNGYVLEQIMSPIVLHESDGFEELKALAARCVTRFHHFHFGSFAQNQWKMVSGPAHGTVKGLLYTYRPLLAGIHLMRTGVIESNLATLNGSFGLSYIDELIGAKTTGAEKQSIGDRDMTQHEAEFERLSALLEQEAERSGLPDNPPREVRAALNDLLIRLRLAPCD
ncbi:MAG: nucleotidyltransferase domain-containing protein [Planctomycetota bacterium]